MSFKLPLGESPDEPAHYRYIEFIAQNNRLPINQVEREAAGYRADWPPLYHLLVAPWVRLAQSPGPDKLKTIYANPRRLLPLDGLAGMIFLHTDDEAFPFKGIVRSWHVVRIASVILVGGTLWLIFLWLKQQFSTPLSLAAVMAVGLIPQFVAVSSVLNDDNLLGFLIVLFLWLLWPLFKQEGTWRRYLALGAVAGLTLVTKYSALFLPFSLLFLHLLLKRRIFFKQVGAFTGGYVLGAGWWFVFVIYYFHQIDTLGPLRGALAPFLIAGSDLSTHQVAMFLGIDSVYTSRFNLFSANWGQWFQTMFATFWFPTAAVKPWLWQPMLLMTLALIASLALAVYRNIAQDRERIIIFFWGGYTLLFVPLPLIRFVFTENVAETAQGRHILFPLLLPLAWLIIVGVHYWLSEKQTVFALLGLAFFFGVTLVKVAWPIITFAHSPYLPVKTSLEVEPDFRLDVSYGQEIKLIGLDRPEATGPYAASLTLVWQAQKAPAVDYSVRLTLLDQNQNEVGLWWGQPVNGRYPTRAWEEGDVVYDTIWLPLLPELSPGAYALSIQLLDEHGQPVPNDADGESILTVNNIVISNTPEGISDKTETGRVADSNVEDSVREMQVRLIPRGDRFKTTDPYRYRSTVAMLLTGPASPEAIALASPDDKLYEPRAILAGQGGNILLFTVDWRWASGEYDLVILDVEGPHPQPPLPSDGRGGRGVRVRAEIVSIFNNHRLTEPPPISRPVKANFDNQFMLLGYDLPVNRVEPGQSFEITLYWRSLQTTNTSYKVFNHLLDSIQTQYGGRDRIPQDFYSTVLWKPGEVVVDRYNVPVFPEAPDGIYWLDIGLYPDGDITAPPLPLVQGERVLAANSVLLGPVKVGGQPALSIPSSPPQQSRQVHFGDVIRLEGYSLSLDVDQRRLNLDLYWSPIARPALDYTVFIHVVNQSGQVMAQGDGLPLAGLYPTSFWEIGEQIFDRRQIPLPGLPPGLYQIRLGWYDAASGQRLSVADNPEGFIILDKFHLN